MMDGINVLAIGSGPMVYEDQLKSLVKDPSKDLFTTNDSPQSVVQRMDDLSTKSCIGS